MTVGFPGVTLGTDARGLAAIVNRLNAGKLNCTGAVVLAPGATSTVVADSRTTAASFIGLSPLTVNAAAEMASGTLHVAARGGGSFTLAHAESAQTDRSFVYVIIG